ncbi:MAG: response regulator [Halioglobus sp.]
MLCKNALVVDDSLTARTVLKHQLNEFDVIVESACDGSHALELLRNLTPDVIFLDHIMPGLNGFEVLQQLKKNQSTRGIPVVMYTSQAAPQYTSEAKSLGAIGVIPKAVSTEQLMLVLDKAELYQLEAVNADQHTLSEKTDATLSSQPIPAPLQDEALQEESAEPLKTSAGAAKEPIKITEDDIRKEAAQRLTNQPNPPAKTFSLGGALAASILVLLVIAQGYMLVKDRQQQQVIASLHQQVLQQEQLLLDTQETLASEQKRIETEHRELTEATWRQVQFVVDILLDQIEQG